MEQGWVLKEEGFCEALRPGREALFTVGNGYVCARGFFEESQTGLAALGGVYGCGVYGKTDYKPWRGEGRELVNLANPFWCRLRADGEVLEYAPRSTEQYSRRLDLRTALLTRECVYRTGAGKRLRVRFERFASMADRQLCGQAVTLTALEEMDLELEMGIDGGVTNLNWVSSEPLPVQPGRRHLCVQRAGADELCFWVDGDPEKAVACAQRIEGPGPGRPAPEKDRCARRFAWRAKAGETCVFRKTVRIQLEAAGAPPVCRTGYEEAFAEHAAALARLWRTSDIEVEGPAEDQQVLRYNLLQLLQSCPWHDERQSIGARGLTGEMYEGCIFWDTEIFMLPFFTLTQPAEARRLLAFRYHTLPEARLHAGNNWLKGAFYPWQCSEKGIEQTPQGVGAFYSIHIVADIAYAILHYWRATGDDAFMDEMGFEILLETARFWLSRITWDEEFGRYNLLAVRGPNEYDVIVNNNFYTNYMARENLRVVVRELERCKRERPQQYAGLVQKTRFTPEELVEMPRAAEKIYLCYDPARELFLEDDMYDKRVPVDMKKAQPTAKRIIDTTIPYEALMLYRISKQADVIHLMNLYPHRFTQRQKRAAWDYYLPKTAHDSSLSYSQHSVMASGLGLREQAYEFFKISARLDVDDVQLNTISGLHFANFGGTYQAVVYGMCGVTVDEAGIHAAPQLPDAWRQASLTVFYRGVPVRVTVAEDRAAFENPSGQPLPAVVWGRRVELAPGRTEVKHSETV